MEAKSEIKSDIITDNMTYNDCPQCLKTWPERVAIPGVLHRTKLCTKCVMKNDASTSKANRNSN